MSIHQKILDEIRRLTCGPAANEKPQGVGIIAIIIKSEKNDEVLNRVKSVLINVDQAVLNGWPTNRNIMPDLPEWFENACEDEISHEEFERRMAWLRSMEPGERVRASEGDEWSIEDWIYWMEPSNRCWFWWNAVHLGDHIRLEIVIEDDPFLWGALRWVFRAAGAVQIEFESGSMR